GGDGALQGDVAEAGDRHQRNDRGGRRRRVCDGLYRPARSTLGICDDAGVRRMTEETTINPAGTAGESPSKKWYVVTTYSTYENKVKVALQERIRQHHMEEKFGEILIPSE